MDGIQLCGLNLDPNFKLVAKQTLAPQGNESPILIEEISVCTYVSV
jgi:hypothetical protein